MNEIRCLKCNKKLGIIQGGFEIKCPRCSKMNYKSEATGIRYELINGIRVSVDLLKEKP